MVIIRNAFRDMCDAAFPGAERLKELVKEKGQLHYGKMRMRLGQEGRQGDQIQSGCHLNYEPIWLRGLECSGWVPWILVPPNLVIQALL